MHTVRINILDPIECEVSAKDVDYFYEELKFEYQTWHKKAGGFGKVSHTNTGNAFSFSKGPVWRFWTGLLPRVVQTIKANGGKSVIIGERYWEEGMHNIPPDLPGETFRSYQENFITDAVKKTRGLIIAATGTGKTFIQLGLASCFPSEYILILADRKAIVTQTYKEGVKYFGKDRVQILENNTNIKWLNICTRQKFKNLVFEPDVFSIVMLDEVHHLSSFKCEYQEIMQKLLAPLRFGFTASYPKHHEIQRLLALEAFIGPKIGEYSIHDAAEDNVLAKPQIKIIREDESQAIKKLNRWPDVNEKAIINNMEHNNIVAGEAATRMEAGKSVLIFVNTVEHMLNLDMLFKARPEKIRIKMVHSSAGKIPDEIKELQKEYSNLCVPLYKDDEEKQDRIKQIRDLIPIKKEKVRRLMLNAKRSDDYKQWLIDKKINGAISTPTWREGVNIPSLNTIILAGGGKEARKILQEIGRGLRKTDDKTHVEIIDFFNPSHYHLINHFGNRFCEYLDNNWEFING